MSSYGYLEKKIMIVGEKLNNNKLLMILRDAFILVFPLTIFGSIALVICNFPYLEKLIGDDYVNKLKDILNPASSVTMSVITIFICLGIGYYTSINKKINPIYGALISLTSFLLLTPFTVVKEDKEVISYALSFKHLGVKGMFVGIIASFIAAYLYSYFTNKDWKIRMPKSVPDAVSNSFSSLIPAVLTLALFLAIRNIFLFTPWGNVHDFISKVIQIPLTNLGKGLIATLVAVFLTQIFWFFGLHGQIIINSVMDPIWRVLSLENYNAFRAGNELPNIVTKQFIDTFTVGLGGTGMTLIIVISMLIVMKSRQMREIGKLAAIPGIFNINEPCIFGLPIVLNPIILIPWVLAPVAATLFAYIAMYIGIVPPTTGVEIPWATPVIINGFLATNSIMGSLLQILQMIIVGLVWLPFLTVMDNRNYINEEKN